VNSEGTDAISSLSLFGCGRWLIITGWQHNSAEQPLDDFVYGLRLQGSGHELKRRRRDGFARERTGYCGVTQVRLFGEVRGAPAAKRDLESQDLGVEWGTHCSTRLVQAMW
jgi:hypothetical protein